MVISAESFFASAYGEQDPHASDAVSVTATTRTGPKEVVLDPPNRRVKVLGLPYADLDDPLIQGLVAGLTEDVTPMTKLTIYAPPEEELDWIRQGFLREGTINGFFADGVAAHLWARYSDDGRDEAPRDGEHDQIVALAGAKEPGEPVKPEGFTCRVATEDDAPALATLLAATFSDYPTPLDAESLRSDIAGGHRRFRLLVDAEGLIAAAASAEIDHKRRSAEMTDCATNPDQRGRGLMSYILRALEIDLVRDHGIQDVYTLARADEPGMNCVFSKLGYSYTGRLVNNCRMPNGWESMNVWCRRVELQTQAFPVPAF